MSDTQIVSNMGETDRLNALNLLLAAEEGFEDAIQLLTAQKVNFSTDETELKRIKVAIADANAELAKVRARITAFQAGTLSMPPPSQATIDSVAEKAADLDQLVVSAQTADTIINGIELLVKAFDKSQSA